MRTWRYLFCLVALTAVAACSRSAVPVEQCNIPDLNLKAAIYAELGISKLDHVVPCAGLAWMTRLVAISADVQDLTGLEHASNLQRLSLVGNRISDLSPLAHLTELTGLDLAGNRVQDLAPLQGLGALTELYLDSNLVADLGPLVRNDGLQHGKALYLRSNCLDIDDPDSQANADIAYLREHVSDLRVGAQKECTP